MSETNTIVLTTLSSYCEMARQDNFIHESRLVQSVKCKNCKTNNLGNIHYPYINCQFCGFPLDKADLLVGFIKSSDGQILEEIFVPLDPQSFELR